LKKKYGRRYKYLRPSCSSLWVPQKVPKAMLAKHRKT
jgi:hypothetical protein